MEIFYEMQNEKSEKRIREYRRLIQERLSDRQQVHGRSADSGHSKEISTDRSHWI